MQDGTHVAAEFFGPFNRDEEPFIRIATGDYSELKRKIGRDHALAVYIDSMSHEIVHYYQWLQGRVSERGVAIRARGLLLKYAAEVNRP
jgi:hypothetical protein